MNLGSIENDYKPYLMIKILMNKIEKMGVEAALQALSISEEELKMYGDKLLLEEFPKTPACSNSSLSIEDHISFKAASPHLQEFDGLEELDLLVYKVRTFAKKTGESGKTALNVALERQDLPMIKLLICLYPELLLMKHESRSPLHEAALYGASNEIIDWLTHKACLLNGMAEGIDLNVLDNLGNTPLHYALQLGNRDLALYLIKKGANKNIENKEGLTPADSLIQIIYHNNYKGVPLGLLLNLIQIAQEFSPLRGLINFPSMQASSKTINN